MLAIIGLPGVQPQAHSVPTSEPGTEPSGGAGPKEPVVFTVGTIDEIDSLNPMLAILSGGLFFSTFLYDGITTVSHDGFSAAPGLAESWEGSEDSLTWTYHFRTGLHWSDGRPLTAEDAAYTLNRIQGGPGEGTWGNYLTSVEKIEAPDPATLVLHLEEPNSILPRLPIPVMPKHVLEPYPNDRLADLPISPGNLVSSGPFRLIEGSPGGSMYRFENNPDNWRGPSDIDVLTFRLFKSQDTITQALVKGEIDYTRSLSVLQAEVLKKNPDITARFFNATGEFRELGFNTGSIDVKTGKPSGDPNPAVLDPRFRYALTTAIDRQAIADKAFQGGATPLATVIAPAFEKFRWDPPADEAAIYDPERSARLLDEAGYRLGPNGVRTLPDGTPLKPLRLIGRSDDQTSLGTVQLVREWFENLGIPTKVTAMEENKLQDVVQSGNYDVFDWSWGYDDDPESVLMYFTCDQRGLWSDSWYCNDEYDALYASEKRRTDPEKRIADIRKMQQVLYRDAPYIITVAPKAGEAYRSDRFHGLPAGDDLDLLFDVDSFFNVKPGPAQAGAGAGGTSAAAGDTVLIVGAGAGAVLLVGALWLLVRRRRRATAEDRA
ncbi:MULTISPECIES: ABC transporter substrate-binding protein [unclassified Mycolicibacterium]|uniref:ABC transporter substrate-binding protein n=1 Tax=unclassified Mycolicibacterium TaxID=2636767 RepID=UPI001390EBF1|nr:MULTISPECIES: ABC transporter substrate-binding protein [unclassified Mycolicibacterium]